MCSSHKNEKPSKADIHNQEHERWSRRSFLQALGLAGGGSMMLANANITASAGYGRPSKNVGRWSDESSAWRRVRKPRFITL